MIDIYKDSATETFSYTIASAHLRTLLNSTQATNALARDIVERLAATAADYYWAHRRDEILQLITAPELQALFVQHLIKKLIVAVGEGAAEGEPTA